jgi:AraC-like DNA-binding protein
MKLKSILRNFQFSLRLFLRTDDRFRRVDRCIELLFIKDCYYLFPDANLADFSRLVNITEQDISSYIREKYDLSFDDLCTCFRLKRMEELLDNSVSDSLTMNALIERSGFKSLEDFYLAYKKKNAS